MSSSVIIALVAAADQAAKALITSSISQGASIAILGGVVRITHVRNPGSAFGAFETGAVPVALTIALMACWAGAMLLKQRGRLRIEALSEVGAALVLGGALGNLVDRVRVGRVIDFIDLGFWPVFNLADAAIALGAVVLVSAAMRRRPGGRSNE